MSLSIRNWIMTGLVAVTFIFVFKVLVNKYNIKFLQPIANA
jgi:hypothetical protein